MKKHISVGITGGIGSGKTYVCRILESMGYPVFYSDEVAKKIIANSPEAISALKNLFGDEAYTSSGELNRTYLANAIFNNAELRAQMNDIVHPLVRKAFENWVTEQDQKIVFNEAAILFETGGYKRFDYNVLVAADESIRIERIKKRDGSTEEDIRARMNSQWPDEKKAKLADFVIKNDGMQALLPQINEMLNQLK